MPNMLTLRTLVEEQALEPARLELVTAPPRIHAADARTRSVLGYLSTNCGSCHNVESSIANLGLLLKEPVASHAPDALLRPTSKWQIPHAPPGASRFVTPGAPDLSALLVRMRSRRPSSQMPPLGTVLHDREAIDLVTAWIADLK
jgi:mono/diheme cytochrome c family protein